MVPVLRQITSEGQMCPHSRTGMAGLSQAPPRVWTRQCSHGPSTQPGTLFTSVIQSGSSQTTPSARPTALPPTHPRHTTASGTLKSGKDCPYVPLPVPGVPFPLLAHGGLCASSQGGPTCGSSLKGTPEPFSVLVPHRDLKLLLICLLLTLRWQAAHTPSVSCTHLHPRALTPPALPRELLFNIP